MSPDQQRRAALGVANERRIARSALRRELRADPARIRSVLLDPPSALDGMMLTDVLLMPSERRASAASATALAQLGRRALVEGVNLLVRIDSAPLRTRRWLADNAEWRVVGGKRMLRIRAALEAAA